MMYSVNGVELEADDQGYLLEAVFDDEAVRVIAAAENIVLTDAHWEVINYLRDQYREEGATPNFRLFYQRLARSRTVCVDPFCRCHQTMNNFGFGPAPVDKRVVVPDLSPWLSLVSYFSP